jgi:hypothetical protein
MAQARQYLFYGPKWKVQLCVRCGTFGSKERFATVSVSEIHGHNFPSIWQISDNVKQVKLSLS